jgi:membrane protein
MSSSSPADRIAGSAPPIRAGRLDLRNVLRDVIDGASKDDILGLASELTHHMALTVFPFLLMVTALPSIAGALFDIPDPSERLSSELATLLSKDSGEMLKAMIGEMTRTSGWPAFLIGLFGSLWAGLSTTSTVRKALNRIYRFDDDMPFLQRKLEEIWLTVAIALLFLGAFISVLVGPALLGSIPHASTPAANLIALALVLVAVSLIYWQAPSQPHDFEFATPGSLFFAVTWLLFSLAFAGYLSQVGTLNHVYGSLGAIIALLFWLYGTAIALLMGAEINASLAKRLDPKTKANANDTDSGKTDVNS